MGFFKFSKFTTEYGSWWIINKSILNVCKSCFVKLRDFRHVRRFLTHDVSVLVANALVSSRLDYCNSLFRSLSKFSLCKLQCIQNRAARIVSNTSRYTSVTPVLKKLHWLPVEQRMVFKTATLVYKFLHTGFPSVFCSISFFLHQFLQYQVQPKWWQFPCHSKVLPFYS